MGRKHKKILHSNLGHLILLVAFVAVLGLTVFAIASTTQGQESNIPGIGGIGPIDPIDPDFDPNPTGGGLGSGGATSGNTSGGTIGNTTQGPSECFPDENDPNADRKIVGWAWSSTTGWISMSQYGFDNVCVERSTGLLYGNPWSANLGWIEFPDGCPITRGSGGSAYNDRGILKRAHAQAGCRARLDETTGAMTGYMRFTNGRNTIPHNSNYTATGANTLSEGVWAGWVALSGPNHESPDFSFNRGVTFEPLTGFIGGYGWGGSEEVVGWVQFNAEYEEIIPPECPPPPGTTNPNCDDPVSPHSLLLTASPTSHTISITDLPDFLSGNLVLTTDLTWTSPTASDMNNCEAVAVPSSSNWIGAQLGLDAANPTGTRAGVVIPAGASTTTYFLTCSDPDGTPVTDDAIVTVALAPVAPPLPCTGPGCDPRNNPNNPFVGLPPETDPCDLVGFVDTDTLTLWGIDVDHCFDPIDPPPPIPCENPDDCLRPQPGDPEYIEI